MGNFFQLASSVLPVVDVIWSASAKRQSVGADDGSVGLGIAANQLNFG